MNKSLVYISALVFFCVSFQSLQAQTIPFRSFSIEQGLSESVAHDLIQDQSGYIWVATGYGLNRFDGIRFQPYYEEQGLADNQVNAVFEDRSNRLWVGTDSGISILENDTLITPAYLEPVSHTSVQGIFQDMEGNFWLSTDGNGIWKLDQDYRLTNVTDQSGYRFAHGRSIAQTADGTIWVATEEGLMRINRDQIRIYRQRDGLPDERIRDVVVDHDDHLWVATYSGLAIMTDGQFEIYDSRHGLINERIQTITLTGPHQFWLGTENGASFFDGEQFRNFTAEQGLSATIIYSTLMDREGNIWLGTLGNGVNLYTGDIFQNYTVDNGLLNNVVNGFEEDSEGNIWIGMYGGGLIRLEDDEMVRIGEEKGLTDNKVYTMFADSQNRMWIGTREGLFIYENGSVSQVSAEQFPFQVIRKIGEIDNEYWIATYKDGLIRYDGEIIEQYNTENGLLNNTVMDYEVDDEGNIWIATYGGVAVFDGTSFRHFTVADGLPSNGVIHIHIDHNGDKWLSTFKGIARISENEVTPISGTGANETIAYFIFQDDENRYWVGTNRGLFNVKPEQLFNASNRRELLKSYKLYNQNHGLVANELNAGASLVASDGTVWLGTVEGLSHFFPDRIRENNTPPGLEIENVRIGGVDVTQKSGSIFEFDQNLFEVSYSGLSFESPDQLIYEYRMRGLDEGWQVTQERSVRYPSLSPNEYRFEIRVYNADGIQSEKTAAFSFTVLPPFYLSWWFLGLTVAVGVGLILFYYQYFKVSKQVDIERMRVQIASDLHDDVGSSLTELALQTDFLQAVETNPELKDTLQQIGDQSRKIVSSLDDIVWSIDSRNDTAGDLTDRMQDYVNHIFKNGEISTTYNFDNLDMDEKLPVNVKENVYLIFKEAVNNIVKHSETEKVEISFSFEGKNYDLEVKDYGKNRKKMKKSGQGLRNMQLRADRIDAKLEIETDNGFSVNITGSI